MESHIGLEPLGTAIDIDYLSILSLYEMHRTDTVVKRQIDKIFIRRTPVGTEIIYLHRGIEINPA